MTTTPMTRDDVKRIVREARVMGVRPVLDGADLREADLFEIDLSKAYLRGVDLSGANLRGANLSRAKLDWANLSGADLYGADLRGAVGVVDLGRTPSGPAWMVPLPNGTWQLTVGCWDGTRAELRTLIAGDDWPDATGTEQARRRPILASLADHADNLAAYHHDWLQAVVKRWGDKETTR